MSGIRQVFRDQIRLGKEDRTRMLVPITGNDTDERLLGYICRIAERKNTDIALIYVVEVDQELPLDAELPAEFVHGEQVLQHARDIIRKVIDSKKSAVSTDMLQARLAGAAIVDEAIQDESDVILMAASVHKRLGKRTCGEAVEYVMKNAPCEVVVLRTAMPGSLVHELEVDIE